MIPDEKRPVTLEDLLRLKRVERPAPEFWEGFDRELRAKQLAALVERRPWWRDLPGRLSGFRRYHLPLGATAVLAITFLTVRDYEPAATERTEARPIQRQISATPSSAAGASVAIVDSASRSPARERVTADESPITDSAERHEAPEVRHPTEREPSNISLILASGSLEPTELTPSARSIAANLAAAEAAEPAVVRRLLGLRHGIELGRSGAPAIEPLQQMASPTEVRLARFDSPMARTASLTPPSRSDDRVARDIDVYERAARRIGGGGDRLTVKF